MKRTLAFIFLFKKAMQVHLSVKGEIVFRIPTAVASLLRLFIKFLWFDMENRFIWLHFHSRMTGYSISCIERKGGLGCDESHPPLKQPLPIAIYNVMRYGFWTWTFLNGPWGRTVHVMDDGKYHARPRVLLIQRLYPYVRTICGESIGSATALLAYRWVKFIQMGGCYIKR